MDAERILGSLVRGALGGSRGSRRSGRRGGSMLPAGTKGMLGMGALGIAIAAFDHFTRQQKASGGQTFGGASPTMPAQSFGGAPPTAASSGAYPLPPPPPPGSAARVVPPPPPPPPAPAGAQNEALLVIRAMIAAANADHELDAEERERIVRALGDSGASDEDRKAMLDELERPLDIATLARSATTPALRRELYLASEMVIDADTRAEQNYLARLAKQLELDDAQVEELRGMLAGAKGA